VPDKEDVHGDGVVVVLAMLLRGLSGPGHGGDAPVDPLEEVAPDAMAAS
jgi:hypothetical protein